MAESKPILRTTMPTGIERWLPMVAWLRGYRRSDLVGDVTAGLIVAVMLVPQSMAYAMLAGLPPEIGLYASIAPLAVYALLGTSRSLAVGPVAIVSLMVASSVGALAAPGSAEYLGLAITLALLVGLVQLSMGLLRLGVLVNFLSHPVISGFTSAAALTILVSQLEHLLGLSVPRGEHGPAKLGALWAARAEASLATVGLGLAATGVLLLAKPLRRRLMRRGLRESVAGPITRALPLVLVVVTTALVSRFGLDTAAGVAVVGQIPRGLPSVAWPGFDPSAWRALAPTALAIAFVAFLESVAVAKALAARRRERIDASQELIGLGAANLAAALTGGYAVTGGFSRSVVNDEAGARTGLASLVTAGLLLLTVLFLTPLFEHLPRAVLGAIVVVAVAKLIDLRALRQAWRYSRADAASLVATFVATLVLGVETGVLVGVLTALLLHAWRTSVPHVAILGRLPDSESYRNVLRHEVETDPCILVVRVDESLYFADAAYLETWLLNAVAERPTVDHVVLVGSAINFIDGSALETLEHVNDELEQAGVTLHLAAIKGPVMDRLRRVDFLDRLSGGVFERTHTAVLAVKAMGAQPEAAPTPAAPQPSSARA